MYDECMPTSADVYCEVTIPGLATAWSLPSLLQQMIRRQARPQQESPQREKSKAGENHPKVSHPNIAYFATRGWGFWLPEQAVGRCPVALPRACRGGFRFRRNRKPSVLAAPSPSTPRQLSPRTSCAPFRPVPESSNKSAKPGAENSAPSAFLFFA